MAQTTFIDLGGRRKGRPRGKPFKKGEPLPFQFKPGQSGNPGGKPKVHQTMKAAYEAQLRRLAPIRFCREVGLSEKRTWATVIALRMIYRAALGDTAVAKEIREVTEGRLLPRKARCEFQNSPSA